MNSVLSLSTLPVPKLRRLFCARQRAGLAAAWGHLFSGPRLVGAKGAGPNWQTCFPQNKLIYF